MMMGKWLAFAIYLSGGLNRPGDYRLSGPHLRDALDDHGFPAAESLVTMLLP